VGPGLKKGDSSPLSLLTTRGAQGEEREEGTECESQCD